MGHDGTFKAIKTDSDEAKNAPMALGLMANKKVNNHSLLYATRSTLYRSQLAKWPCLVHSGPLF